jgi:hypothetical protein
MRTFGAIQIDLATKLWCRHTFVSCQQPSPSPYPYGLRRVVWSKTKRWDRLTGLWDVDRSWRTSWRTDSTTNVGTVRPDFFRQYDFRNPTVTPHPTYRLRPSGCFQKHDFLVKNFALRAIKEAFKYLVYDWPKIIDSGLDHYFRLDSLLF